MDATPELVDFGLQLSSIAARNTATAISDKVRALRAGRKHEEIISGLEEIVSDLVADKAELTRLAQAYQEELVSQRLTDEDVKYITDTVVPLMRQLAPDSGGQIDSFAPLLSRDTVNVLQILGFDFRRALGIPLTQVAERAILGMLPGPDVAAEGLRHQIKFAELAMDAEAYGRFRELFPL